MIKTIQNKLFFLVLQFKLYAYIPEVSSSIGFGRQQRGHKTHKHCNFRLNRPRGQFNTNSSSRWPMQKFSNSKKGLQTSFFLSQKVSSNLGRGWKEPGNKTLQGDRILLLVLFKKRVPDQEGRPAGQRQSGAGAGKRFLVLFRIIEQDQELVQNCKEVIFNHFKTYNQ